MTEDDRRKLELPDRRQHTYEELSKKLDTYIASNEKKFTDYTTRSEQRFSRFFFRALVVIAIIGFISAGSLAGFALVLNSIQTQRKTYVRISCQETNKRHNDTTMRLIQLADADIASSKTKAEKNDVIRRRNATLGLISALAPYENCDRKVRLATNEQPKGK